MSTSTDIKNMALRYIGNEPRGSFEPTEDLPSVKACNLFYDTTKRFVLRADRWKCCTKRVELAQSTATPAFEWSYQFDLPVDCLRVHEIQEPDYQFKVEGRFLLTNYSSAKIIYTADVDEGEYDAMLVKVIALSLAIEIAAPLMGSASSAFKRIEQLELKVRDTLTTARSIGAMEELKDSYRTRHPGAWARAHQRSFFFNLRPVAPT